MSIHRFFRRQFPLRSRTRGIAFLCFILLMSGCGGEESVDKPVVESVRDEKPINDVPIAIPYYPMTVGNRWVYRNPDGSEWSREVAQSEIIEHVFYYSFTYDPPLAGEHPDFIRAPTYVDAPDGILLQTKGNDINDAVWQTVLQSNENPSRWGRRQQYSDRVWTTVRGPGNIFKLIYLFYAKINVTKHSDFTLLHLPADYPQRKKAIHMTITGHDHTRPGNYAHGYEVKVRIWENTSFEPVVTTSMGRFENCLKLEYSAEATPVKTLVYEIGAGIVIRHREISESFLEHLEDEINKELAVLVPMLKYNLKLQTMWLAPGVGPVKIETLDGYAELIDYEIKTVPSSQ